MPILDRPEPHPDRNRRAITTGVLGLLALLLLVAGGTIGAIESSFGPVNLGSYSLSGPRTWTVFPGSAQVLLECGGYQLWTRQDPRVIDGT